MPLQNRVDPLGRLHAVSSRGTYTGNRGVIHDKHRCIIKSHTTKRWIYCRLNSNDKHREVMMPNRWTELFFLDDATALAAGHRPCGQCQHARYQSFMEAWRKGNNTPYLSRDAVDDVMHDECMNRRFEQVRISDLPDGVMVRHEEQILIKRDEKLFKWTFEGYHTDESVNISYAQLVTPLSIVKAIGAGFSVFL